MVRSTCFALVLGSAAVFGCSAPAPLETPVVVASGQDAPHVVAVDGATVFWADTNADGCAIFSAPAAGGAPTQLAFGGYDVQDIAVDQDAVYWTEFTVGVGGIGEVSRTGGDAVTLLSAKGNLWLNPHHLVVADGWIYFTNSGSDGAMAAVVKVPTSGGNPVILATGGEPDEIAVDATSIYWTDSAAGTVDAMPRAGGSVTVLASGQESPTRLAIDATNAYWTTSPPGQDNAQSTIRKVSLSGGSPVDLSPASSPSTIVSDGAALYWVDAPHDGDPSSALMKLDLATAAATQLADAGSSVDDIALGGASVYWADFMYGTIDEVAK